MNPKCYFFVVVESKGPLTRRRVRKHKSNQTNKQKEPQFAQNEEDELCRIRLRQLEDIQSLVDRGDTTSPELLATLKRASIIRTYYSATAEEQEEALQCSLGQTTASAPSELDQAPCWG